MDAPGTCDMLINSVKSSNLNYYLNETPFQVTITIKKTFVQRYNTKESSNIIHDPLSIFSQLEGQGKGGIAPQWQVPKLESASAADQMENGSNPLWLTPPPPTRQSALKLNDISASARDLNAASMEIKSTPDYLKHKYKPEEQDTGTNCSTYHAQLNTKQGLRACPICSNEQVLAKCWLILHPRGMCLAFFENWLQKMNIYFFPD